MAIPSEILKLWQQYSSAAFPKGYDGKEISGINLPLLDVEIAGYIRMYVNHGTLDFRRVESLRELLIDLNTVILLLDSEELTYFNRLRELANLVLQEVGK